MIENLSYYSMKNVEVYCSEFGSAQGEIQQLIQFHSYRHGISSISDVVHARSG